MPRPPSPKEFPTPELPKDGEAFPEIPSPTLPGPEIPDLIPHTPPEQPRWPSGDPTIPGQPDSPDVFPPGQPEIPPQPVPGIAGGLQKKAEIMWRRMVSTSTVAQAEDTGDKAAPGASGVQEPSARGPEAQGQGLPEAVVAEEPINDFGLGDTPLEVDPLNRRPGKVPDTTGDAAVDLPAAKQQRVPPSGPVGDPPGVESSLDDVKSMPRPLTGGV
eukprot:jgi/Botrbrau1/12543/Bobra.0169s0082.1